MLGGKPVSDAQDLPRCHSSYAPDEIAIVRWRTINIAAAVKIKSVPVSERIGARNPNRFDAAGVDPSHHRSLGWSGDPSFDAFEAPAGFFEVELAAALEEQAQAKTQEFGPKNSLAKDLA